MTTRLQLVLFPFRRSLMVYPHFPRGGADARPGTNFAKREPEVLAAERRAIAERKPKGVLLNFDCKNHRASVCAGCLVVEDDRLARWLCDAGYTRVVASDTASSAA